jgi:hypothetical protein
MSKRYTHDYMGMYEQGAHSISDRDSTEFYTDLFELEASEHLQGLVRDDVGGVILYWDSEGLEAAYFDYENLVGSIYSITGRRSDEI